MATAFQPLLSELDRPNGTVPAGDTSLTGFNTVTSIPQKATPVPVSKPSTKTPLNPDVIPQPLINLRDELAKEGSSTSTLSTILAIIGAAKGDFRGLQQIEEAKRRTALGKAIVPHIEQYNKLVNEGKLDEAGQYLDTVSNSFGARAPDLIPYLTQMTAKLNKRQEGLGIAKSIYDFLAPRITEDNPNYPIVAGLKDLIDKKDLTSETILSSLLTRTAPNQQTLNNRIVTSSPMFGGVSTQTLPQVTSDKDIPSFVGNTLGAKHNITIQQLADVLNGVTVKDSKGNVIDKNSEQARKIIAEYTAMQPISAQIELAKMINLEPTQTLQLVKQSGAYATALKLFGPSDIDSALNEHMKRLTEQQVATTQGTLDVDPRAPAQAGLRTIDMDPASPTYLREVTPATYSAVKQSGGKLAHIRETVVDNQLKPAQQALDSLSLIPEMLSGTTPESTTDRLATGINQRISAYLGIPVTQKAEIRQRAKAILNSAIEQTENIIRFDKKEISGRDRIDIAQLKQFATGDFRTSEEYIQAADYVKSRLQDMVNRAVGGNVATGTVQPTQQQQRATPPTNPRRATGQTTIETGPITLPQPIQDAIKRGETSGSFRSQSPSQPQLPEVPVQQPPQTYDEQTIINNAFKKRKK